MLKLEFWIMYSILCSPRLHLFDQKYNKNSNIVKYYLSSVLKNKIKAATPVFSVTWSFRHHSNMMISCSINISDYYQY